MNTQKEEASRPQIKTSDYLPLAIGGMTLAVAVLSFVRRRSFASLANIVGPALLVAGIYKKITNEHSDSAIERDQLNSKDLTRQIAMNKGQIWFDSPVKN